MADGVHYFRNWRIDGTWVQIHDRVRTRVVNARHPSPSEAIVDSQSVKSAAMVSEAGYDAAKQVKDANALLRWIPWFGATVWVTAASVGEQRGKQVLKKVKQMGKTVRLHTIWVDFDGEPFLQWVMDFAIGLYR